MQIFVDADACPVVDIIETIAEKYNIPTTLPVSYTHLYIYQSNISSGTGAVKCISSPVIGCRKRR